MSAKEATFPRATFATTILIAWRVLASASGSAASATDYIYPAVLNWADILADLNAAGISGYRVAALMGIQWGTVGRWLEGSEPRHSYGQALLALHTRYCGAEATQKRQREARVTV